jgi:hypothetical protein
MRLPVVNGQALFFFMDENPVLIEFCFQGKRGSSSLPCEAGEKRKKAMGNF